MNDHQQRIISRSIIAFDPPRQKMFNDSNEYVTSYMLQHDMAIEDEHLYHKLLIRYFKRRIRSKNESLKRIGQNIRLAERQLAALKRCQTDFGQVMSLSLRKNIEVRLGKQLARYESIDRDYKTLVLHLMEGELYKAARETEKFAKGNSAYIQGSSGFQVMIW